MATQSHEHVQTLKDGKPFGGFAKSVGLFIAWQEGPLAVDGVYDEPNGAFVETVLRIAKERLEFFQESPFVSVENAEAIDAINKALYSLNKRTSRRTREGKEGTWEV